MMASRFWLISAVILAGCASREAGNFTPFTTEIINKAAFDSDLSVCRKYAQDYLSGRGSVNPLEVAQEGARAGLSDMGYSVISPTAPALGALGGASSEAVSELGLNGQEAKKIISNCMHDKGQKSGNYLSIDPYL